MELDKIRRKIHQDNKLLRELLADKDRWAGGRSIRIINYRCYRNLLQNERGGNEWRRKMELDKLRRKI
jgi:hypothetical protein